MSSNIPASPISPERLQNSLERMAKIIVGMSWTSYHGYDRAAEIASFACTALVVYLTVPRHATVDAVIRASIHRAMMVYYDDRGVRRLEPTDGIMLSFDKGS